MPETTNAPGRRANRVQRATARTERTVEAMGKQRVINRGPYTYEIDGLRLEVDGAPVEVTEDQAARLRADGATLDVAEGK